MHCMELQPPTPLSVTPSDPSSTRFLHSFAPTNPTATTPVYTSNPSHPYSSNSRTWSDILSGGGRAMGEQEQSKLLPSWLRPRKEANKERRSLRLSLFS